MAPGLSRTLAGHRSLCHGKIKMEAKFVLFKHLIWQSPSITLNVGLGLVTAGFLGF